MGFDCQECEKTFTKKYNLKRHMEQKHDSLAHLYGDKSTENESEDESQESGSESEASKSEGSEGEVSEGEGSESEGSETGASQNSGQSDASDSYTYEQVQAILRYFLQTDEN